MTFFLASDDAPSCRSDGNSEVDEGKGCQEVAGEKKLELGEQIALGLVILSISFNRYSNTAILNYLFGLRCNDKIRDFLHSLRNH